MANQFHLYLIRHGQSANNAFGESRRVEDPALTEIGERQAELLAERFRSEKVSHLLTSGFLRAVQTMRPLAKNLEIRPTIWTDLHEVGGCYSGHEVGKLLGRPGMSRDDLSTRFPEFLLPEDIDHRGWWQSKPFEQYDQAKQRAKTQSRRLLQEFDGQDATVACVIHADFKALLLESMVPDDCHSLAAADLVNAGVTLLSCSSNRIELLEFNCSKHLSEELITS